MRFLIFFLFVFSFCAIAQEKPDRYSEYLQSVQREMDRFGTQMNINNPNPFITGSALQGYFMNEKILLLERDAYFMMKSNKLETTEDVADYQHRLKVLASHSNNILLSMARAVQAAKTEGFTQLEAPKHQIAWEELIEICKKDPNCISKRLASGELVLQNDLIDSFAFSMQLFKQIPHMHAIEFASMFQLVQLLQMETVLGHAILAQVEFDIFLKKQKKIIKELEQNTILTSKEKEFHRTLISNTVNKWKKKILERKFDQKERFKILTDKIKKENLLIIVELDDLRSKNPEIMSEEEICRKFLVFRKDRRKCLLREKIEDRISDIRKDQAMFVGQKEKKIPEDFWKNL